MSCHRSAPVLGYSHFYYKSIRHTKDTKDDDEEETRKIFEMDELLPFEGSNISP